MQPTLSTRLPARNGDRHDHDPSEGPTRAPIPDGLEYQLVSTSATFRAGVSFGVAQPSGSESSVSSV
jgi:hypothetical protein